MAEKYLSEIKLNCAAASVSWEVHFFFLFFTEIGWTDASVINQVLFGLLSF